MKTRTELTQAILEVKSKMTMKTRKHKGRIVSRLAPYSWRDVAAEMYPNENQNGMGALLNKIVKHPEYQPSREVCLRLGLLYSVPIQICQIHGVPHCYDCQSQEIKPKRVKEKSKKRTPSIRIGEATDAEMVFIKMLSPAERKAVLIAAVLTGYRPVLANELHCH
jgi:hypothetical protein